MGHPDKGQILALLDGELPDATALEVRVHIDGCQHCRAELDGIQAAALDTARALDLLDVDDRTESARLGFLRRADGREGQIRGPGGQPLEQQSKRPSRPGGFWTLPRAASIAILLTGITASALPGSPVRRWLVQTWQDLTHPTDASTEGLGPEETPTDPAFSSTGQGSPETGAGIPAHGGGVEIWINGLSDEAGLRVLWTGNEEAWIYAGEGTRFTSTDGRLEANDPPGDVRVEIPEGLDDVTLGLDGTILLRKSNGELEILAPVEERSPSEIRFEGRGPTNAGGP